VSGAPGEKESRMTTAVLPASDVRSLLDFRSDPCVSLFLPTERSGPGSRQNAVRLKNLLRRAEERLRATGLDAGAAAELLAPARDLVGDDEFWRHPADGLALFVASGFFQARPVPLELEERVEIGDDFALRPLLPLLAADHRFFVLALSQNANRLYEATPYDIRPVDTPRVPASLEEALRFDEPERQLQFHTRTGAPSVSGARRAAMFHGHGVGVDDTESNVLRYCQQIDRGLAPLLADERAPLIVASVDYERALYRRANSYGHLLEAGIDGNPELSTPAALLRAALPIVEPLLRRGLEEARERFGDLSATALASSDLEEIVAASWNARIETLLFDREARLTGRYDPATNTLERSEGADAAGARDLIDLAARKTLAHGGQVFALERARMPVDAPLAAIFRYALAPVEPEAMARANQGGRGPLG
jgi:hypothetical protein